MTSKRSPSNKQPHIPHQKYPTNIQNKNYPYSWSMWRLIIPLCLQTGLILAIAAPNMYTYFIGKTVVLQTNPIDPYDWLQAHSLEMDFPFIHTDTLKKLSGWKELVRQYPGSDKLYYPLAEGTEFYLTLQQPTTADPNSTNTAWQAIAITSQFPTNLAVNQVAIKGYYNHGSVDYKIGVYRILPTLHQQMQSNPMLVKKIRSGKTQPMLVTIKVSPQGHIVPIQMQVGDRIYRF